MPINTGLRESEPAEPPGPTAPRRLGVSRRHDGFAFVGVVKGAGCAPLTLAFCFLDDVGIGRHGDSAPRYRMRSG